MADGFVFVIVIGGYILYNIIPFLLQLSLTIILYGIPIVYIFLLVILGGRRIERPEIPAASDYDSLEMTKHVGQFLQLREKFISEIKRLYETGKREGAYLTKGSEESRFDTRARLGRELNDKLDVAEQELARVNDCIDQVRYSVSSKFPDWIMKYYEWSERERAWLTLDSAKLCFVITAIISYSLSLYDKDDFIALQMALLWNPLPDYLISPFLPAALVTMCAYRFLYRLQGRRLARQLEGIEDEQWEALRCKWNGPVIEEYFVDARMRQETSSVTEGEDWQTVLKVGTFASPDEIKIAYRDAMKSYHPDRVAGLGEKLQVVAESETKRLNAAYQAARLEKGF